MEKLFIDVEALVNPNVVKEIGGFFAGCHLIFLMAAYGYILFSASNLISEGSELLLLVPSMAGIVGSVVLPVLGAVPDGAIVLFSGMGPVVEAQQKLSVGVGALAGSTIMLLTVPWMLSIIGGRVGLKNGRAVYKKPRGHQGEWSKVPTHGAWSLTGTGVQVRNSIKIGGFIMLLTVTPYIIIQGPAFFAGCAEKAGLSSNCHGASEKYWALAGLIVAVIMFVGYLAYQVKTSNDEGRQDKIDEVRKKAINQHLVSLSGVFAAVEALNTENAALAGPGAPLLDDAETPDSERRFREVLWTFFKKYDANNDHHIDSSEMRLLLKDLNENPSPEEFTALMDEMDTDKSGSVDFDEFCVAMRKIVHGAASGQTLFPMKDMSSGKPGSIQGVPSGVEDATPAGDDDDDDDDDEEGEEEEVPEDLEHLTYDQQQTRIKMRAAWMLLLGTTLVVLFSDPMVGCLNAFGELTGVPPFYVSFILAPLASNASELIASFTYAQKKTKKTITISLSALQGAAVMNNTFCLGIFLALIFFRAEGEDPVKNPGLYWAFSAETISILVVQIFMFVVSLKKVEPLWMSIIVIALFPASIAMVAILEGVGLD